MTDFQNEWGFYLQAFRLHQGLTRASNEESRRLLRRSMEVATTNKRTLPRSYGLLSFVLLSAWLADWIDDAEADTILQGAIGDLQSLKGGGARFPALAGDLQSARKNMQKLDDVNRLDSAMRTTVLAYATAAHELDKSDFENHWSLATANLYAKNFAEALGGYEEAEKMALSPEVPQVSKSSLSVDFVDARFFAGDQELATSDESYITAIEEAIERTDQAIAENPSDSKRFRWYWTLGWAYYELGGYSEPATNYERSRVALEQLRNPHDLIRKNLIATYAALDRMDDATRIAADFLRNNPKYSLAVEDRWPYRNPAQLERWKGHLAKAGLDREPN